VIAPAALASQLVAKVGPKPKLRLHRGTARKKDCVSDRVPQHEPPDDAELIQPEVDERDDSIVVEGDDRDHVLPPTELDPFTPDTTQTRKQRTALWLALLVVAAVVVVIAVVSLR
jgi:hypothetical protein